MATASRTHQTTPVLTSAAATTDLAGCPRSIWHDSDTPAATVTSSGAIELGVRFRADRDGYVTGIRFYKGPGNTGTHVGRLWSWNGELLAEATFTGETASGWQQVSFASPVRVGAGAAYVAAYYAPVGHYSYTWNYFASAPRTRAPLSAVKSVPGSTNETNLSDGVYHTGAGFPAATYQSTNYWVDPVFDTPAGETCPATIWTDTQVPGTPGAGEAASVELGVKFRSSQAGYIQGVRFYKGAGNTGTHIGRLWSSTGTNLAQATFQNESATGWQQVWFAQPVAIAANTTYVASYYAPAGHYTYQAGGLTSSVTRGPLTALAAGSSGGNGVYVYGTGGFPTSSYNATNYAVDVLFTTSTSLGCPCGIWPSTAEPATEASTDAKATELGVRFTPLRSGYVKGIRFFKGDGNTGIHIGRLWSSTGTSLAQATFTNETANGWQQVLFSSPVAVTAGTAYVASYYAPAGHYAYDQSYFAVENTSRGPLAALADGVAGANSVYRYGAGFPTSTYLSSNYWVDVVFDTSLTDVTPPVVQARTPAPNATAIAVGSAVSVGFSKSVSGAAISLTSSSGAVSGSTSYNSASRTATFTPSAPLKYLTDYTVTVSGARDAAGHLMTPTTWLFTTAFDPNAGPGGPIGVITDSSNPYSSYYAEILRAEGLNEFTMLPLSGLSAASLSNLDVAILGDVPLTAAQVTTLTTWVTGGGRLIAMHPDPKLAALLGLSATGSTLSNAYIGIDTSTPAGAGITSATMQFHGTANRYTLAGASMVARLYSSATTATSNPAVSTFNVGTAGGRTAAFSYDLARSVVQTRQGNPAWAGQERDGTAPIRSDDMFYPNWVDLSKVSIPQADEQQRLLANLIETFSADLMPLPRFWYLPWGYKAVVVSTGDDESPGTAGTSGRFDRYLANSPAGCSPSDWQCLRFTAYLWTSVTLSDAQARAYTDQGFEVALHPQNGCVDFTPSSLEQTYADQLTEWAQKYYDLTSPETARYHCIVYSDWDSQPKTELRHGIRFDANYYYWPGSWIQDRPGFMTGSGIPMRFTDTAGRIIDVYQGATDMTNESGQTYPYTPDTLLDNALGSPGYYGVFVTNEHQSNRPSSFEDDMLVASAQNHGVPVVTSRDVLHFLDGRGASSFSDLSWSGDSLRFTLNASRAATGLRAMLPTTGVGGTTLSTLTRGGVTVNFDRSTVKGIEYAMFAGDSGSYVATYTQGVAAVTAATASTTTAGTATVNWSSGTPGNAEVAYGTSPTVLTQKKVAEHTRQHSVQLHGLVPGTTYYYRVTTTDARGRSQAWPGSTTVASFTTPARDTKAPTISGLRVTPLPDGTVRVNWKTDEPSASRVAYGTTPDQLNSLGVNDAEVTSHTVVLSDLVPGRQYDLRVASTDVAGNQAAYPASPTGFVMPSAGVVDQTRVAFRTGKASGALVVRGDGLAALTLSSLTAADGTAATGSFDSRILDPFEAVRWRQALWTADIPAGARLSVSVRTGNTAKPDATWSDWTNVAASGSALTIPADRYLQYRIQLTAGPAAAPALHWIGFTYDQTLSAGPAGQPG